MIRYNILNSPVFNTTFPIMFLKHFFLNSAKNICQNFCFCNSISVNQTYFETFPMKFSHKQILETDWNFIQVMH